MAKADHCGYGLCFGAWFGGLPRGCVLGFFLHLLSSSFPLLQWLPVMGFTCLSLTLTFKSTSCTSPCRFWPSRRLRWLCFWHNRGTLPRLKKQNTANANYRSSDCGRKMTHLSWSNLFVSWHLNSKGRESPIKNTGGCHLLKTEPPWPLVSWG